MAGSRGRYVAMRAADVLAELDRRGAKDEAAARTAALGALVELDGFQEWVTLERGSLRPGKPSRRSQAAELFWIPADQVG